MSTSQLLLDAFDRVQELVTGVVDRLTPQELAFRVDPGANSIAWLLWHLARIEDDHITAAAGVLGRPADPSQVWVDGGFDRHFGLPFAPGATGYGHTPGDVGKVTGITGAQLRSYYDAVHGRTVTFLDGLAPGDYDTVVDERWDPPVTLAARLVSVLGDTTQHVGQAAFVRGVLQRTRLPEHG